MALLDEAIPVRLDDHVNLVPSRAAPRPHAGGIQRDRSSKLSSRQYPAAGHNHFDSQGSDPGNNHHSNRHRSERGNRIPDSDIFFFLLPSYPSVLLSSG